MDEGIESLQIEWPDVVVAVSAAGVALGLAAWIVRAPPTWAAIPCYLLLLPVGLGAYWFGRRLAWLAAASGSLLILISLTGDLNALGFSPHVLERVIAAGLLFPTALMLARRGERSRSTLISGAGRPSDEILRQAVVASPSNHQDKALRQAQDKAAILSRIGATISADLDLSPTLNAILVSTRQVTPYDVAEITLWDGKTQTCVSQGRGGDRVYAREAGGVYCLDEGFTGWIIRHRRPLLVPDVQARQDVRPKLDTPDYPFQSYVGVPLQMRDRFVGTLELASYQKEVYTERDVEMLQSIGRQAAVAIENARLHTQMDVELRRREEALSGLQRISREINATLELEHILDVVLEEAMRLGETTRGVILLREAESDELRLKVDAGYGEVARERFHDMLREPKAQPALAEVLRTEAPLLVPDLTTRGDGAGFTPDARSILIVPILYAEALAGLIALESVQRNAFDQDALEVGKGLADQAAIAIGNARRYREQVERGELLRQRADQLASVLEVGRALRSDRPLENILEEVAYGIQESVGFDLVLISVLEGDLPYQRRVAAAGIPLPEFERLKEVQQPWSLVEEVMKEEFRISQSYYIPAERQADWRDQIDIYTVEGTEALPREPGRWHPNDMLIVPLVRPGGPESEMPGKSHITGILSVDRPRDGRAPDRSTIEALEIFASQAALAIENTQMVEMLQRRAEVLALFNEISQSTTAKLELNEVLDDVVETAPQLLTCDHSSIFLLDARSEQYVPKAVYGSAFEQISSLAFLSGEGLVGQVAESGLPLTVEAVERDLRFPLGPEVGMATAALIPLTAGNQVVGVLCVGRREPNDFSPAEVAMLSALADQVSVAVDNARLFEEAQQRAAHLSTLNRIGRQVGSILDRQASLQHAVDAVREDLGYRRAAVLLVDDDGHELHVAAATDNFWDVIPDDYHQPVGKGAIGTAAEIGETVMVSEAATDPLAYQTGDWLSPSSLSVPIEIGGLVIGILEVEDDVPYAFDENDRVTLEIMADQIAISIENARLYEEVQSFSQRLERRVEERTEELAEALEELTKERDRVEALYRITSQLAASLDLDHVLNKALALLMETVGADRASTLMVDSDTRKLIHRAAMGPDVKLPPGGKPIRFSVGEGLAGWAIKHRKSVIVPDISQDTRWVEPRDKTRDYRSALAVPLLVGDEVLGALLLLHATCDYFNEEHLRLVETAATQIAQAVNNAKLYHVIHDQAQRLGNMLKGQQVEAAKSQAILEGVADGVMVTDAEGKVILFNAAAERILDLPREEAMGRTTREMLGLYGSQSQDWMETVTEWAERPEAYVSEEYLAAQLNIEPRVVSVHLAPVLRDRQFLGTVSVFRDVTAEVEADRAKTEFVSMVSHELRTPMTSIKGYADLMLMEAVGGLTEGQEKFLSIIRNNVNRLAALVDDLLDISRIESGRLDFSPEPIEIQEAIDRVVTSMEARAEKSGLLLRAEVPPALPPVNADADRVVQILTNLVGNACQYTPSGGEIVVSAYGEGDEVCITVRDTGIGIAPENQEKIFDRFFRADDPMVQDSSGTGLGLHIVRSLVEMHGGRIWIESEPGEGSAFTFTLPTQVIETLDLDAQPSAKVLVVEDDPDIANLLRLQLSENGREVLLAHRGDEALASARRDQPDLITLDIMLPDMSGFDVLDVLKSDPVTEEIPVIIVSVVSDRQEGLRLGAVDYVTKPIEEEKLLGAVQKVLTQRNATVLVVDDDRDTLSLLREILHANDFGVRTVSQGRRVLPAVRKVHPSLILLDLKLPDLDGYAILEQLKDDPETRDIPVIVMTGSEIINDARRQRVLALGADRFVSKPFSVRELVEEIEMVTVKGEYEREDDVYSYSDER